MKRTEVLLRNYKGELRPIYSARNELRAKNYYNNLLFELFLYGTAERLNSHELVLAEVEINHRKVTITELVSGGWYPNETLTAMGILDV